MKKVLFAILSFSLLLTGCSTSRPEEQPPNPTHGDTPIAEAVGAPEQYTFHAVSESGKSEVSVEADVIVPEAYGVDLLTAEPTAFTDDDVIEFVRAHTGDFTWYDSSTRAKYDGGGLTVTPLEDTLLGIDSYGLSLEHREGETYHRITAQFWKDSKTGELALTPSIEYTNTPAVSSIGGIVPLNEDNRANDCTISLEEAIAFADKEANMFGADFSLAQYGQMDAKYSAIGDDYEYYVFKYTREINGIPVNVDSMRGVGDGSNYVAGNEAIWIAVNDGGVCYLCYRNPVSTGELVEANVKLMPFEEIADIFEKVSLLQIKPVELYEELRRNDMVISEVRLGYMAVKQSESVGGYRYIPVWDFYGTYTPIYEGPAETLEVFEHQYSQLPEPVVTINAIDGTVIDRSMGY